MVNIEFVDFNDPVKKMYDEVYPCIFEPKTKIPADFRSVHHFKKRKYFKVFSDCKDSSNTQT